MNYWIMQLSTSIVVLEAGVMRRLYGMFPEHSAVLWKDLPIISACQRPVRMKLANCFVWICRLDVY